MKHSLDSPGKGSPLRDCTDEIDLLFVCDRFFSLLISKFLVSDFFFETGSLVVQAGLELCSQGCPLSAGITGLHRDAG